MKVCKIESYARECVSTEAIISKRFKDGLNEDIHLLVGILKIKESVVLVEQACKAEDLRKRKEKLILKLEMLERDLRVNHFSLGQRNSEMIITIQMLIRDI